MFAFIVAGVVVLLSYRFYFANNLVAPIDRAYVASIKAGASMEVARDLAIWAIPGALLQLAGGPKRQMGILFGTGLLLGGPLAGWAVLVGIALLAESVHIEIPQGYLYFAMAFSGAVEWVNIRLRRQG